MSSRPASFESVAARISPAKDWSTQYLSIRYPERLLEEGIESSLGSVGDSYDNALAETVNGLFKTELIRRHGPWQDIDHLEHAVLGWVDWWNDRRILGPIGFVSPKEFEAHYYEQNEQPAMVAGLKYSGLCRTRGDSLR